MMLEQGSEGEAGRSHADYLGTSIPGNTEKQSHIPKVAVQLAVLRNSEEAQVIVIKLKRKGIGDQIRDV
jgi:hypothetical protein